MQNLIRFILAINTGLLYEELHLLKRYPYEHVRAKMHTPYAARK